MPATRWFTPLIPTGCIAFEIALFLYIEFGIYRVWAFISVSVCASETATQQNNVLPLSSLEGHTFAKNRWIEGPRPSVCPSGVARWDSGESQRYTRSSVQSQEIPG